MMSPVAYQPKPDVLDVEMMDGEAAELLDEPSTTKVGCAVSMGPEFT